MDSIKYHIWNKADLQIFKRSIYDILDMKEIQLYQPYFSLYFHIHNTKDSHKRIDIQRRYIVKQILDTKTTKHHTSNTTHHCIVHDTQNKTIQKESLFCKCVPLLDPLHFMMNNYSNLVHRNPLLPSCYISNTQSKINDMCNSAYIDTFMSSLCSVFLGVSGF